MSAVVAAGTRRGSGAPEEADQRANGARYELCFRSLVNTHGAMSFPCDAAGHVDIDGLSEQARHDYLYARAVIGRVYDRPAVQAH